MFRSAAAKLTLGYLTIIMTLSIGFSVAIYHISSNELERSASRPVDLYNNIFGPESASEVNKLRQQQLNKDRNRLKLNLTLYNLAVLAVGGGLSYFLARRTLAPIEEMLEMQKRFTGDASHELRTPLTAMQSEIEVALRDPDLSKPAAVKLLKSNLEEVAKLKALSEGLLTLATAGQDTSHQKIPLNAVCAEAIKQVTKRAKDQQINIKSSAEAIEVMGNHQQILNLLSILLDNAIKYSPKGSEVKLSVKAKDRYALITVADRGAGIARKDLPHIFDRFYRADSSRTKSRKEGYGLGLAIAKKIVDLHNGVIDVNSQPAKGSTFSVRFPLA